MRSAISRCRTVYGKTMTRFWPIWALWLLFWLLNMPLNVLMEQRYGGDLMRSSFLTVLETGTDLDVMIIGYAAICAMAVLSPLYKARSANFMGSLPVRREGLFVTYYLAGFSFVALPSLLVGGIMLILGAVMAVPHGTVGVLLWLVICLGKYLFYYSFAIFCGMFAGHILALPAYYGIFNVLAYALYSMIDEIFRTFYYGFTTMGETAYNIVKFLTPASMLYETGLGTEFYYDGYELREIKLVFEGGLPLLIYAIVGVFFTAAALLLFRKRRLESAEDVVAVPVMKPVFRYSVAFCAGLFFGYVTNEILNGGPVSWMICTMAWAVFGSFAAQMILDKSFKVFRKWKGAVAVAAVFGVMYVVIAFDLTGFETRIPEPGDVQSITVEYLYVESNLDIYDMVDVTDPERIQNLIALHQTAVDQRDGTERGNASMRLLYHLKNGTSMERRYNFWVDPSLAEKEGSGAWGAQSLLKDRDFMWHALGLYKLDEYPVSSIELYNSLTPPTDVYVDDSAGIEETIPGFNAPAETEIEYFQYNSAMPFVGADAERIVQAIREDFQAGRFYSEELNGEDTFHSGRQLTFYFLTDEPYTSHIRIEVPTTALSTQAVLDELVQEVLSGQ